MTLTLACQESVTHILLFTPGVEVALVTFPVKCKTNAMPSGGACFGACVGGRATSKMIVRFTVVGGGLLALPVCRSKNLLVPRWAGICGFCVCLSVAWRRAVRCGVVWCGVVWCGVVWCGVVWRGVAWCGVV